MVYNKSGFVAFDIQHLNLSYKIRTTDKKLKIYLYLCVKL